MGKSIEEIYEDLILQQSAFENANEYGYYGGDDEDEDFFSADELAKNQEILESKFGEQVPDKVDIEEDVYYKRYSTRREHKYTETEMNNMRESAKCTLVHDYGEHDIYHLTDEERAKNDMLSEIRVRLGTLKHTYGQVDQYVHAMRIVVEAWEILSQNNYIHTDEEFFNLVSQGKIVSSGIIMPKLKRMNTYNMDLIIKYISNPELDPSDLVPKKDKSRDLDDLSFYAGEDGEEGDNVDEDVKLYRFYYNERMKQIENDPEYAYGYKAVNEATRYANAKMEEINMERLLSPEEIQYIYDNSDNPPAIEVTNINPKLIKGYDRRTFDSKNKKLSKKKRYSIKSLHDMLNKIQLNPDNREESQYSSSYSLTHGMFDVEKPEKDIWDDLRFNGSWANDTDVWLYDLAVREEILKQHTPKERYYTYGDKEVANFFKILEDHGVNTVDLRRKMDCTSTTEEAQVKAEKKENKKIESQLLARITELNKSKKFKKIVGKAEDELNKQMQDY